MAPSESETCFTFGVTPRALSLKTEVEPHEPYEVDAEAMELHESLTVADLHADTLLWLRDPLELSTQGHVAVRVFNAVTKTPVTMNLMGNSARRTSCRRDRHCPDYLPS